MVVGAGITTTQKVTMTIVILRLRVWMLLILLKLSGALVFSLVSSAYDGPPLFTSITVPVNLRDN